MVAVALRGRHCGPLRPADDVRFKSLSQTEGPFPLSGEGPICAKPLCRSAFGRRFDLADRMQFVVVGDVTGVVRRCE